MEEHKDELFIAGGAAYLPLSPMKESLNIGRPGAQRRSVSRLHLLGRNPEGLNGETKGRGLERFLPLVRQFLARRHRHYSKEIKKNGIEARILPPPSVYKLSEATQWLP